MTALHARPGGDLRVLTHARLLNQPLTRIALPIKAQQKRNEWHLRLSRCSAVFRQFAAAGQSQWSDVRSSLCIGAGVGALACTGGSGPNGPSLKAGGSGGSGGDGWHAGPGHSSISNVLSDVAAVDDGSSNAEEQVVLLDVGGMKCGGCVGHVKKLLEQHPEVSHATVNLATETALVRVTLAQGADLDKLAAELAKGLTNQGFTTSARERRGSGWVSETALNHKRQQKLDKLRKTTQDLAVAWGLSLLCGLGHLAHLLPNAPGWMHALHNPALAATLSAAALLGPGRDIMTAGWQALSSGRPDMNSLVGLGATASFAVSCVAAGLPALRWKTFFEEPAMLLGFVLVGRALEERAKLQASSDMAALQGLMPQTARLALGYSRSQSAAAATSAVAADQHAALGSTTSGTASSTGTTTSSSSSSTDWVEVPADAVGPGDVLMVLPGDRVPVDGAVLSGRSTVDESALTGEPLPLVKQAGSKVTAGTLNCDGSLLVSAEASGQDTVIADIVRLVESAQARTAPIQRLADTVAGKFAYGVMGISAATFAFWSTIGAKAFPGVLTPAAAAAGACCPPVAGAAAAGAGVVPAAAAVLLGLQLACNVIVVACPCALGLATPTAVLVGTAAGARKGLLVRGGDILEATSQVDTVVFDKTGTLTAGRPVVAGITMLTAPSSSSSSNSNGYPQQVDSSSSSSISPRLMLQLAAAVEQQATHPVGKALLAAAAADRAAVTVAAAGNVIEQQQHLQERKSSHAEASNRSSSSNSSRDKHTQQQQHHLSSSPNFFDSLEAVAQAGGTFNTDEATFLQEPGSGAVAVVAGHKVSVGTREWVEQQGAALTAAGQQLLQMQQQGLLIKPGSANTGHNGQQLQQQQLVGLTNPSETLTGHTQVFVGVDDQIVGLLDVADMIRSDACSTIQELHQQRIKTIMLSGDRKEAAIKVAAAVGIPESNVFAGIKPAGKAALIEDLKRSGHRVAMVGDGINDTAALAAADVGMAMAGGVDAASDVSKVVLMGDQLHQVADAIELSKKTLRKIQQNLGWAFCYNLVGIPLAAGVLLPKYGIALTPSISGALMGFSSLAVMANSLLLQLEVRGMRNGLTSSGNAAHTLQPVQPAAAATAFAAAMGDSSSRSSISSRDVASLQRHQGQQRERVYSSSSNNGSGSVGGGAVVVDLTTAAATSPAAAAGDS